MKETIRVYVRLKPLDNGKPACLYESNQDINLPSDAAQNQVLQLSIPKQAVDGYVNNSREVYRFHFDGVLGSEARQADVFASVAKPIVDKVLDGYNGTLFAYGQTGSGKTFTITGNGAVMQDTQVESRSSGQGIIPRTLSYLFAQLATDKTDKQVIVTLRRRGIRQ